jgi:hypothetical protein
MTEPQLPEGVTCACGEFTKFPPYVYAHWDIELVFTCPQCKRKYTILGGTATENEDGRTT